VVECLGVAREVMPDTGVTAVHLDQLACEVACVLAEVAPGVGIPLRRQAPQLPGGLGKQREVDPEVLTCQATRRR
jgi:hypothetical protein